MSGQRHEHDRRADAFAVECPGCRAHVAVARALVDHVAGCPRCRAPFVVPTPLVEERAPARREAAAQPAAPLPAPSGAPLVFFEPPPPSTRRRDVPAPAAAHQFATAHPSAVAVAAPAPAPVGAPVVAAGAAPTTEADVADLETALSAGFAVPERAKTIRSGGVEIELRRLTPEERRARRARRNLVMLVVGAALLVAIVVILGKGGR